MKRSVAKIALTVLMMFVLSGCSNWMSGEYLSVKPYEVRNEQEEPQVISVTSYAQLRNAIRDLVEKGAAGGLISIASFHDATADFYINTAINHVVNNTSMGAYAVRNISYEIGTNRGNAVVVVQIDYLHGKEEILSIKEVDNSAELEKAVTDAMNECNPYLAVHTENYEKIDFGQIVSVYANAHPDLVMETPHVTFFSYPERGSDRIIEIVFTYQTDTETLLDMQQQVEAVFTSAELYVKQTSTVMDTYSRLYSFLMGRNNYTLETSLTPSYSLLLHGVGDSRAFANVYAAMCRNADLECRVISGLRDGEPWCWNLIRFRGGYYHVDLLRCYEENRFAFRSAEEMIGYVWDSTAYPQNQEIQKILE